MKRFWDSNLTGAAFGLLFVSGLVYALYDARSSAESPLPPPFDVVIDPSYVGPKAHPCPSDPQRSCITLRSVQGWP